MTKKSNFESTELIHKDVLVLALDVSRKTESGIITTTKPSILDDRPTKGKVVKISSKVSNVKIGDVVYFDKTTGIDHFYEDKPGDWFILIDCKKILGKEESSA